MSLLIANVVPEGLIFAADRNLSADGLKVCEESKLVKVGDVVAGYVGQARAGGTPMCDWLSDYLDRHREDSLREAGPALAEELEATFSAVPPRQRGTIVHVGGFEEGKDGRPLPVIWYVRDAEIQTDGSVRLLGKFKARDEFKVDVPGPAYFGDATGEEIRERLRRAPTPLPWAGFRQSWDLAVFGNLDELVWFFAGRLLDGIARETTHSPPTTIEEWEPFMRFPVLAYAAYFEAFYPPGQRPVGGGVDVESVPWPE